MAMTSKSTHRISKYSIIDILFLFILISSIALITTSYVSQEKYWYSWDYIGYQASTDKLIFHFKESFWNGVLEFLNSLVSDYSKVFCIPILPLYLIQGSSRLSFILSLSLTYITGLSLTMGYIFSQLATGNRRIAFWIASFITILVPPVWLLNLRGYPDLGGSCIILAGVALYWQNLNLKRKNQIIKISLVLAFSVLFRRPFAYSVRAFIISLFLYGGLYYLSRFGFSRIYFLLTSLTRFYKRIIIISILFATFSLPLLVKSFFINYRVLYSSYEESTLYNIEYYGEKYGWVIIFISLIGYVYGFRSNSINRSKLSFFFLFGAISIIQWIYFGRQTSIHYTAQFSPFIILGISILLWASFIKILNNKKINQILLLFIASFQLFLLLTNILGSLFIRWDKLSLRMIFAEGNLPLVRKDYDQFYDFVKSLKAIANEKEWIYIAASSYDTLNQSMVEKAAESLPEVKKLNIIRTSDIDSRDVYPLNALVKSKYVIVASPIQYHINPNEQKVVRVVNHLFENRLLIAKDFKKNPTTFKLQNGVSVNIYERFRPSSSNSIFQTLAYMKNIIKRLPGREVNWINIDSGPDTVIERDPLFNTAHLSPLLVKSYQNSLSLTYVGSIDQNKIKVTGFISKMNECFSPFPVQLIASTIGTDGKAIESKNKIFDTKKVTQFEFIFSGVNVQNIKLALQYQDEFQEKHYCNIALNHVVVSK